MSSSSSSDSFTAVIPTIVMSSTQSQMVRCENTTPGKTPPFLTAGDITPEGLRSWELGCENYFRLKSVAEDVQVAKVVGHLLDPHIQDWISNNGSRLTALTFSEFMEEVRTYWLPSDWAEAIQQKMLSSMQGNKAFHLWAVEVESLNVLLRGSEFHLTEDHLHFHLESHMHPDLTAEYHLTSSHHEKRFQAWLDLVHLLDEKCVHDTVKLDAALRKKPFQPSCSANTMALNSKAPDGRTCTHPPALTIEERQLLRDNSGCFKCHCLFQNHIMQDCPNDFPDAKNYKAFTAADVEAACRKCTKPVMAVVEDEPASKCSHIMEEDDMETIAVVMPSATLGDRTDSGEEYIAPLSVPHLHWSCLLEGPSLTFPLPVKALIDSSSHLLHKSLNILVALSSGDREVMSLENYVTLSCLSPDSCFRLRSVCAIIAPRLCTPLLLGLPFLSHNNFIINHALRTCISKDTGYDLMNPLDSTVKKIKGDVLTKLRGVLPRYREIAEVASTPVCGVDVVGAVQHHIEVLAAAEELTKHNAQLKVEFADCFPADILPTNALPDDVLFHIQPKDANKVIQLRSYDCPKKYHEAWKTLLQQHLNVGHLRPSNSTHSSPTFIIPKADPTALPRWVNDF
ncbi:hypothetical protein M404DRAFT_22030 [Pisolithus tinctorius Marx 270]|uniref:Uncharacterized protein n=1 Tax=Pisolithus tinctorius Marx 270 TaxID=870435 RepID=A0A0C3KIW3_PISTI|nr:hypothetical protein M404DRAFT_22030 [Pisolithus tinctorius Marx 270]